MDDAVVVDRVVGQRQLGRVDTVVPQPPAPPDRDG
jgi:hypothetical protein